jgi:hypothetical protein
LDLDTPRSDPFKIAVGNRTLISLAREICDCKINALPVTPMSLLEPKQRFVKFKPHVWVYDF